MSDPVREQYERWVYPEPIPDLTDPRIRSSRERGDPGVLGHAYWPDRPAREDLHILVAGCGPNAAARYAFHHPAATVVGLDISQASLAHAQHLKDKHRLANLTLHRLRVEEVEKLGLTFDFIDCSGVLHHLPDPAQGIQALSTVLRPDGVFSLMLYARYGRIGVYMLQEMYRLLGLEQSPGDVAFVKQGFSAFKADHQIHAYLASSTDQNFDSGIVDTFLHRQDRAYTVAECIGFLGQASLVLQGWMENYFYYPDWQIPRDHPLFARINGLDDEQIWQAMELYHAKISTHRFFACHRNRDPASYRISFSGESFLGMVPIPRSGLEIRLGAADTLELERNPFPKVALRGAHAAIFRQVDGRKTTAECARAANVGPAAGEDSTAFCRAMFKELWRLGYVDLVFRSAVVRDPERA